MKLNRRDALKLSGAVAAGLGFTLAEDGRALAWSEFNPPPGLTQKNSLFQSLPPFHPGEALDADEMRISLIGTSVVQRQAQHQNSVFVELGNGDSFVFDLGSGTTINYCAMKVPYSRTRRIFLTHLHGDHTGDLTHLYGFAPQHDGKSPLYLFGPSASLVPDPIDGTLYDDGMANFAQHFREMNRWHTESQSFVPTRWKDAEGDGYDIFATELNWKTGDSSKTWTTNPSIPKPASGTWIAYQNNGVTVSFFPAVHDRNGSLSYRLDWNGLSMIFTGDTKPNQFLIDAATGGVDVLISEIVVPPEVWAERLSGITDPSNPSYQFGLLMARSVQENSHTPQKAFGYILSQLKKPPRMAVGTHFQASDDTIGPALNDIRSWYKGPATIATDFMVINASKTQIRLRGAVVSDYTWDTPGVFDPRAADGMDLPKYQDLSPTNPYAPTAPLAQLDPTLLAAVIPPCTYDPANFMCTNPYHGL